MSIARIAALGFILAAAPGAALAFAPTTAPLPAEPPPAVSTFKCPGAPDITARFAIQNARFGAIVDAGDGPHFLPERPWVDGPVSLVWSDGRRTLTWSPGVRISWVDGAVQRSCGRAGEHIHDMRPRRDPPAAVPASPPAPRQRTQAGTILAG